MVFGDQTAPGNFRIDDLTAAAGGLLYFAPAELVSFPPQALYRSDGTAAGTVELARFAPQLGLNQVADPAGFAVLGGSAFFVADDGEHGVELWVTDGTAAGTRMVRDLAPGPSPSHRASSPWRGRLFFAATTAARRRLGRGRQRGGDADGPDLAPVGSLRSTRLHRQCGTVSSPPTTALWGTELWSLPLAGGGCNRPRIGLSRRRALRRGPTGRDFSGNSALGTPWRHRGHRLFWFFGPDNVE